MVHEESKLYQGRSHRVVRESWFRICMITRTVVNPVKMRQLSKEKEDRNCFYSFSKAVISMVIEASLGMN
jgi:hypothetical protein